VKEVVRSNVVYYLYNKRPLMLFIAMRNDNTLSMKIKDINKT